MFYKNFLRFIFFNIAGFLYINYFSLHKQFLILTKAIRHIYLSKNPKTYMSKATWLT